ncbi:DUF1326 domain-containing protein [Billgrantia kenyensis]|uniref:DUF1326 domain-containing protein n=1 Tax=Billgrantia kenyensis TaxID=321266 RepID=A0A7V9W4C4_9GAMM|nr:DUF1326 domain-containing protein [Halomonas kenyensis]MBA2780842.1 DUF1326 domain-containing protein [Halomonas kenyensis]MCG6661710.1 DUF1326 domain-containing protein [Halomonas kenyensis]
MATTMTTPAATKAGYRLEGTMLEICSCAVPCPCFLGEDPDGNECFGVIAFKLESGQARGVDVSGLSLMNVAHIPGNALAGGWRSVILVDSAADDDQYAALLDAFSGKLGGPLADLAGLVGEVVAVERVPISHEAHQVEGRLQVEGMVVAEIAPIQSSPDGTTATIQDSAFTTVKGAPAYLGKSRRYRVSMPQHGMSWSHDGQNAIQTAWKMEFEP